MLTLIVGSDSIISGAASGSRREDTAVVELSGGHLRCLFAPVFAEERSFALKPACRDAACPAPAYCYRTCLDLCEASRFAVYRQALPKALAHPQVLPISNFPQELIAGSQVMIWWEQCTSSARMVLPSRWCGGWRQLLL